MNRTPLLRPLRDNGATLYIFPSASEDIGLNLDSRTTGVALSHYALLNFPKLNMDGVELATSLLNYVMNFETLLLNQDKYNYLEYHTVSERVFWHWINKKIITDNFLVNNETLNNNQTTDNILNNEYYYIEPTSKYENKQRLVQCFGSIDAGNSVSTEFGMFNETYINIPTSYGNGPILFKQVQDPSETNYIKGKTYKSSGILEGRGENLDTLKILNDTTVQADNNNNTYEATDAYEIVKDINELQNSLKSKLLKDELYINSFDDINVDDKKQFANTKCDITTHPVEFDFNAILLYYTVYDQDDPTKAPYAINLFGIIFLNGTINENNNIYYLPGLTKRKSYSSFESGNFFGNSYSFRVNLKTLSVYDNTDSIIMDNTTMSSIYSQDLSDVISNLNRAIDVMNTNVQSTIAIQDQYMDILRYYNDLNTIIEDISTKVNGFINGSKTSSFNTALLRSNEIRPLDTEENMIRLTLNRKRGDYIDNANYQGTTYISPIIITNDYDTFNVPTVYKPILDPPETIDGDFTDSIGKVQDIIDSINITYYTDNGLTYLKLELPESMLISYGLLSIYQKFDNYIAEDIEAKEQKVNYVNYDGLVLLLITYVKSLKKEIELIKSNSEDIND